MIANPERNSVTSSELTALDRRMMRMSFARCQLQRGVLIFAVAVTGACSSGATLGSRAAVVPLCQANQVRTTVSLDDAAGSTGGYVVYHPRTTGACALYGYAKVKLLTSNSRPIWVDRVYAPRDLNGHRPQRALLSSRHLAATLLMWGHWCHQPIYAPLKAEVALPHSAGTVLPAWRPARLRYQVSPTCYGSATDPSGLTIYPFIPFPPTPKG